MRLSLRRRAAMTANGPVRPSVLALAVILAACSLPVDGDVNQLNADEYSEIVQGLDTTTTIPPLAGTTIRLFFYDEQGRLYEVFRPFVDEPPIPEILTALQEGPSESEQAEIPTLRTELPAGLNPDPQAREAGNETVIVQVDDEGGLRPLLNDNPVKAELVLTQLVCTLTSLNLLSGIPITGVEFHDSQGRIQILDSNGAAIEGAARASDFNDCMTQADLDEVAEEEGEADDSTTTSDG